MFDRRSILAAAGLACAAALVTAGPLTPPAGPVAATYKTLSEVEPRTPVNPQTCPGDADSVYRIAQPGSYYLTGEVLGAVGKSGIEIAAVGVTLDLSGFTVRGVPGSLTGIAVQADAAAISRGRIVVWGQHGVAFASGISDGKLDALDASGNGGTGFLLGAYTRISDSIATGNGVNGFRLYSAGSAINCMAVSNGFQTSGAGFLVENGGNVLRECRASSNGGAGFDVDYGNTIADCVSSYNYGAGFAMLRSTISGCTATSNGLHGFDLGEFSQSSRCNAVANQLSGFYLASGAMVLDCSASANGGAGNTTYNTGFHVVGSNCRLTGNHAAQNPRGFYVASNLNAFLSNNTASGSTIAAFVINTGNDTGPIVTNPGVGFAANNPFANFAP